MFKTIYLVGAIIFGVAAIVFLVRLLFSRFYNRSICAVAIVASFLTCTICLAGYNDLGTHQHPNGAKYSMPGLIGNLFVGLCLSYITGAYLYLERESSLLAHFLTVLSDGLLAYAATIGDSGARWAMAAPGLIFYLPIVWILWSQMERGNEIQLKKKNKKGFSVPRLGGRTQGYIVAALTTLFWSLQKLWWILGEGIDAIPTNTEIILWLVCSFFTTIILPFYMVQSNRPVESMQLGGKKVYIWGLLTFGAYDYEESKPLLGNTSYRYD